MICRYLSFIPITQQQQLLTSSWWHVVQSLYFTFSGTLLDLFGLYTRFLGYHQCLRHISVP